MRTGWVQTTLGQACEIYQPKTISAKDMVKDGKYPVFGANGKIGRYDKFNHEKPQLIIGCRGTCGAVNISEPRSWITGNAMVVRPLEKSLDVRLLEYMFRGGIDISQTITGAAQPQITRTTLSPIKISFPAELTEQKRIVFVLGKTFDAIARAKENAEKNLMNSKLLFNARLNSIFENHKSTFSIQKFEELIENKMVGLVKNSREQGPDKKFTYIKMNNITPENRFDISKFTKVNATEEEIQKFGLRNGDFLFNTRNSHELVGKSCIYWAKNVDEKALFNNNIMRIRFRSIADVKYVYFCFFSRATVKDLENLKSGTTNVSAIYFENLKSLEIPLPPLNIQKAAVMELERLEFQTKQLEEVFRRLIDLYDEVKKSILQKAFAGELKVAAA